MFHNSLQKIRSFFLILVVCLVGGFGCTEDVGDIDRTQPNIVHKKDLQGMWYMVRTITEVPYGVAFTFVGEMSFGANPKIVWDVQEKHLVAYPVTETLEGAGKGYHSRSIRKYWDRDAMKDSNPDNDFMKMYVGEPIAAFKIEKHLDVKRKYNAQTGEQSNVIEENDEDRPWYERESMRVDWSENAINDFEFTVGRMPTNSVPYYVQEVEGEDNPDRPEITDGYISFVIKFFAEPQSSGYCSVYTLAGGDCAGGVVKARYSFKRVNPVPTYNAKLWHNSFHQEKFGFFMTERYTYSENSGLTYAGRDQKINRWNLWRQVWDFVDVEGASACNVDADCNTDAQEFCYQEEWFSGGECKQRRLKRPSERFDDGRGVKPIMYHLSADFPEHLIDETYEMADNWNDVFSETIAWMLYWDRRESETGGMLHTRFCDTDADCSTEIATFAQVVDLDVPQPKGRTVIVYNDGDGVGSIVTNDAKYPPSNVHAGKSLVRFVNADPNASSVDFKIGGIDAAVGVTFDTNNTYEDYAVFDTGKFTISAHSDSGEVAELTNVTFAINGIYLFVYGGGVLTKAQSSLVTGQDGLAGDQGIRVVNMLADHGSQNVVINGTRRADGLSLGEDSGFINAGYNGMHSVKLVDRGGRQDVTCFHSGGFGRCVGGMPEITADDLAEVAAIKESVPPAYVVCRNQFTGYWTDAGYELVDKNNGTDPSGWSDADKEAFNANKDCSWSTQDDCRYTWTDDAGDYHNACGDDAALPNSMKKVGDARYNLVYFIHEAHISSPLGYGPSAADPDTGEIYFATANIYGAPLRTYSQWARDLMDLVHGDLSIEDTISGKYVRDFLQSLEDNEIGTMHGGLQMPGDLAAGPKATDKLPASSPAALALNQRQPAAPMRMMMPHEAPELWRFHSDEEYRKQLLGEVLGGFPTQEQLEARFNRIKGTKIEQMMINNEIVVALSDGQLEPGAALDAEALDLVSPLTWATQSAVKSEHERMRMLTNAKNNTCLFMADFIDDAIYGLAKALKDDQGLSGEDLRIALEQQIYGGVIEHEVGHTIGLRHNFSGSNDIFNYKDEYFDIREKELVLCQNDNWCETPGWAETCTFVQCSSDADCSGGLTCGEPEGSAGSFCVDVTDTKTGYCEGPIEYEVPCGSDGSCVAGLTCDTGTNQCGTTTSCAQTSDCGEGEYCNESVCSDSDGNVVVAPYKETVIEPIKKFAPRPYMTESERDSRRTEYQYSTVMDYGGRFNSDIHGLGKYDMAAIKAGYGEMLEVYHDTSRLEAYVQNAADYYNYPPNVFAYVKDTSWWRYAGTTSSGFGSLENFIGVDENLQRVTVPWEQVTFEHQMANNYIRDEQDYTYIEVPYRACYDEYRGNLGCYYFDTGADIGEMNYHSMNSLQYYYIFDAFKRERYGFGRYGNASYYFSRILDRYMTQLGHAGQYYALYYHIFKDYLWFANWKDAPYDGRTLRVTSEVAFQYLTELISSPSPGSYQYNNDTGAYENFSFETDAPGSELNIPVGLGKFPYTQFNTSGGYYDFSQAVWIGSFWEKVASLLTLTDSTAYFTSDFVSELGVRGATSIGFNTLYQIELTNVLGGIVADEYELFAGAEQNGSFVARPVIGSSGHDTALEENHGLGPVVSPSINDFSFKLFAAVYGLSYLPAGFDPTFTDAMAITYEGNGSQYDINDGVDKITFDDPFGQKTYSALSNNYLYANEYGERAPFEVAYRMLEKANALKTSWEAAVGEPKLKLEAQLKELIESLEILRSLNEVYSTVGY
ncbi:MAG: hypothetical protein CMH54_10005 [Myxococcales bacterium]|mgnify:CR=1 FL=1|nr:hypothetical protein [Myxococcales bacterium]